MKYTGICIGGCDDGKEATAETLFMYAQRPLPTSMLAPVHRETVPIDFITDTHSEYRFVAFWFNDLHSRVNPPAGVGYWMVLNNDTGGFVEDAQRRHWILQQLNKRYAETADQVFARYRVMRNGA